MIEACSFSDLNLRVLVPPYQSLMHGDFSFEDIKFHFRSSCRSGPRTTVVVLWLFSTVFDIRTTRHDGQTLSMIVGSKQKKTQIWKCRVQQKTNPFTIATIYNRQISRKKTSFMRYQYFKTPHLCLLRSIT